MGNRLPRLEFENPVVPAIVCTQIVNAHFLAQHSHAQKNVDGRLTGTARFVVARDSCPMSIFTEFISHMKKVGVVLVFAWNSLWF